MTIRLVKLGAPHVEGEGLRIGAVRRAPRGTPDATGTVRGGDDIWFPALAPSMETLRLAQEAKTEVQRDACARRYRVEMARPESSQAVQLLASLSHETNLSVGCYGEDEFPCHIPILRELLTGKGARFAPTPAALADAVFQTPRGAPRLVTHNGVASPPASARNEISGPENLSSGG